MWKIKRHTARSNIVCAIFTQWSDAFCCVVELNCCCCVLQIIRDGGPGGRLGAPAEANIPNRQLCVMGRRPAVIRTFPKHTKPVDDKRKSTALIPHTRSVAPLKFSKDTNLYGVFELPGLCASLREWDACNNAYNVNQQCLQQCCEPTMFAIV